MGNFNGTILAQKMTKKAKDRTFKHYGRRTVELERGSQKDWSRTVRSLFTQFSFIFIYTPMLFRLFVASAQVSQQMGVLEGHGEAAPADDCTQCGFALHDNAGDG